MIRALVFALCALTSPAAAQFCVDDVADLPLSPQMLPQGGTLTIVDPGMAQIMAMANGFSQIEVFLGERDPAEEAALRDGRVTAATLQAECRSQRPDCISRVLVRDRFAGTSERYSFTGMSQARLRLLSGGQSATIRVTLSGGTPEAADAIAERTMTRLLPALTQC